MACSANNHYQTKGALLARTKTRFGFCCNAYVLLPGGTNTRASVAAPYATSKVACRPKVRVSINQWLHSFVQESTLESRRSIPQTRQRALCLSLSLSLSLSLHSPAWALFCSCGTARAISSGLAWCMAWTFQFLMGPQHKPPGLVPMQQSEPLSGASHT